MKDSKIAATLKYYRKINGFSIERVSALLQEYHIKAAPKTIYGWESGQTQPAAQTLLILCCLYKISDVLEEFGYREKQIKAEELTEEERTVIQAYRKFPEMKNAVKKLLSI